MNLLLLSAELNNQLSSPVAVIPCCEISPAEEAVICGDMRLLGINMRRDSGSDTQVEGCVERQCLQQLVR